MEPLNEKSQVAQEYGLLPADARQQIESVKEKSTTFNRIWIHTFVKVTFIVITFFRRKGTTN